jgi:transposase
VTESVTAGASVSAVARRHGLTPQQMFAWRRQVRSGSVADKERLDFAGAWPGFSSSCPQSLAGSRLARHLARAEGR